jgi:hypothetical protein
MPMTMIVLSLMTVEVDMRRSIVAMAVHMPLLTVEFPCQGGAQDDQENPYTRFGNEFKFIRDMKPGDEDNRSDQQQRERMSDAPTESDGTGSQKRRPFGKHRRNCCKMVRIQSMSEPEQETHSPQCHELRFRHVA